MTEAERVHMLCMRIGRVMKVGELTCQWLKLLSAWPTGPYAQQYWGHQPYVLAWHWSGLLWVPCWQALLRQIQA